MTYLTKQQILDASDLTAEVVAVPEWGGSVRVRGMTGTERDQFDQENHAISEKTGGSVPNFRARVCMYCIIDEVGVQMFNLTEIDRLGQKSGAGLDRVYEVGMRLSGLARESLENSKKNSDGGPCGSSASGSPSPSDAPSANS